MRDGLRWIVLAYGGVVAVAIGSAAGTDPAGQPTELVRIPSGASVREGPPTGWSHRVIRSVPELKTGDLGTLPASSRRTATRFRTVIVADIRRDAGGQYVLKRVGVGNAVPIGTREITVTPEGPPEALATLGAVETIVLQVADGKLNEARIIATTSTFALFRTPAVMLVAGKHADVDLNYALLVDRETGGLQTLAWAVPTERPAPPTEVVELEPDATFPIPLDVRVTSWVGPLPVSWSFAMPDLPPGRPLALSEDLARRLAAPERLPADRLERLLRERAGSSR